ncbi:MAG: FAD-dependent oxidoreductase [candidate division Zixibacteria bacterium]|nr:FAD-dependent oxidoreductase [candidate division Zixibacteria bacterium]NIR64427.1 FAD-dependent oxidoreductase [candidate division Zixibacteria bacterium]NIS16379.1 FAD-dependent oxidoreductase [candidate division Zixibacteria bacterium]NIS46335.1 FAD-dependent oxidoreductase [candidate division Zixibacteria bacterium]NIT52746.1 FAD-dependent oxidoreductase [candidate division Zixibacteria bacterium]
METFSTLKIGSVEIPNRLIMAPLKTGLGSPSGEANQKHLAFYEPRAEGGTGAITLEPLYVDLRGREHPLQMGITADSYIPGLKAITDAIHLKGAAAIAHLNHAGRAANPKASGSPPEAPSAVLCPASENVPEEMSVERISVVVSQFGEAARRAREAGFDIIELQFGLGYLIAQFLSPHTNLRKDEYGTRGDGRYRFAEEVLASVREKTDGDFPIMVRISATEIIEDGLNIHDAIELAHFLEERGVSALHVVSGSACDSGPWYFQHMRLPLGKNLKWAGEIKEKVSLPVIVAGRMGMPDLIRQALDEEMVDAVALGRPLLAQPDFAIKMKEGRDDEIIQCGACLQGCLARLKSGHQIGCLINPEAGREYESFAKPDRSKKVVIVGGGPAGMQAALTASSRGHQVVLFDRKRLGGQIHLAYMPPGKEMMEKPLTGLINKVKRSPIELRIPRKATPDLIAEENPDVVVLASGAKPVLPAIPGLENVLFAEDVLNAKSDPGKRVLILGGGMVGVELAEYLASKKHEVTIVEILDEVAGDMEPLTRKLTLKMLSAMGVKIFTRTNVSWFEEKKAYAVEKEGDVYLGEFDSVIAAMGMRPSIELEPELSDRGFDVRVIGDAKKPGQIFDAVRDGYDTAMEI